jgi:leader peptidase (prepilin peptidase)/N-methyltransferase
MIRIFGTIFAGVMGLCFGSFLNVCLCRWPAGESIVLPRSHCRSCDRTLTWWENLPLVSWLALRGRCRTCRVWIGWRYPLVELSVGVLWAYFTFKAFNLIQNLFIMDFFLLKWIQIDILHLLSNLIISWLLIALLFLDAENLWLPNKLTYPGILIGLVFRYTDFLLNHSFSIQQPDTIPSLLAELAFQLFCILAAAGLILLIRWTYWLIRRREGVGLGDAKLMALLAAWLGLPQALLAFGVGIMLGALAATVVLAVPRARRGTESWAASKLPLGTFLCIGGIVSSLWGQPILSAYLRWAGF